MKKAKSNNKSKGKNLKVFSAISYYFSVFREFIGRRVYIVFFLTAGSALAEGFGITLLLPLIEVADAEVIRMERLAEPPLHYIHF